MRDYKPWLFIRALTKLAKRYKIVLGFERPGQRGNTWKNPKLWKWHDKQKAEELNRKKNVEQHSVDESRIKRSYRETARYWIMLCKMRFRMEDMVEVNIKRGSIRKIKNKIMIEEKYALTKCIKYDKPHYWSTYEDVMMMKLSYKPNFGGTPTPSHGPSMSSLEPIIARNTWRTSTFHKKKIQWIEKLKLIFI